MILIVITNTEEVNFSFMMVIWLFLSAIKSFFACLRYHRRVSSLRSPSPKGLYLFILLVLTDSFVQEE